MSFSSTTNRVSATGNGTTATYSYTFKIFLNTELLVTVRSPVDDSETTLTLTTHYTVSGVGESGGGSITLVNGAFDWIDGSGYLDSSWVLTMRRVVALTQETDIRNQGSFFPETHEDVFDKHIMIDQQQQDELDRSMKLAETVDVADFDPTLPASLVGELSVAIVTNATGDGLAVGPTTSEISNAQGYATAASASATLASQWATTTDDLVATTDNSAKAYAIGGTGAGQPSGGDAKSWATKTSASVAGGEFSSKEYAQGTQASTGGSAKSWAQVTGGDVTGAAANSRSAKSWAQDANTGATLGGSSKDWAQNTSVPVDGSTGYSAKEWALGTQTRGVANSGSSKDWATYTGGTVDDTEYSSKYHAQAAAASASEAATYAAASLWNDVAYKVFGDSPVAIVDGDSGTLFSIDCTSGNVVINLPSIAALSLTGPWSVGFVKSDSSTNTVTINRDGTDVIDGGTSYTLGIEGQGVTLVPDADAAPDEWTAIPFGNIRTLVNATLTTPNTDIVTMDGQASTPSNPSSGYYKMYVKDDSGKLAILDSAGTETEVGSGGDGVKNYITRGSFETASTVGWSLKRTTLTNLIPDQVAASWTTPSVLTLSATQTGALTQSGYTMSLAASGATTAGDMLVTDPYALDLEDQAKTLSFKFSYQAYANGANLNFSGTSTNTFHVYIYDSTNDVWIQPTGCYTMVQGSGVGIGYGTFQTPSNMASFRLAFVSANASAGAFTLYLDNISVGPQYTNLGVPVTDWVSYTPTFNSGFTVGTGGAENKWLWRRVGDSIEISGVVRLGTSGASMGTGDFTFTIPSGMSIDTTKTQSTAYSRFGVASIFDSGVANGVRELYYAVQNGGSLTTLSLQGRRDDGVASAVSATFPFTFGAADQINVFCVLIPISGWSSNTVMSSDAATNVVAVRARRNTLSGNQTISSTNKTQVQLDSIEFDTNGLWNISTYKGTIKVSGYYRASANIYCINGSSGDVITLYVERVSDAQRLAVNNELTRSDGSTYITAAGTKYLNAGDEVAMYVKSTSDTSYQVVADNDLTTLSLERISGPTQIAASEVVAFQAYGVPTSAAFDGSVAAKWSAATYDTHGGYSPSTGKYSIRISGFHRVSAQLGIQATTSSNGNVNVAVFKNTTLTIQSVVRIPVAATLSYFPATSGTIYCNAGDTIEIRANSYGITSPSIVGGAAENFFIIERLGGIM